MLPRRSPAKSVLPPWFGNLLLPVILGAAGCTAFFAVAAPGEGMPAETLLLAPVCGGLFLTAWSWFEGKVRKLAVSLAATTNPLLAGFFLFFAMLIAALLLASVCISQPCQLFWQRSGTAAVGATAFALQTANLAMGFALIRLAVVVRKSLVRLAAH
ncbi:MAG: hypothetical protein AB1568_01090 [Thermodesulfobacteriota bacterium]